MASDHPIGPDDVYEAMRALEAQLKTTEAALRRNSKVTEALVRLLAAQVARNARAKRTPQAGAASEWVARVVGDLLR